MNGKPVITRVPSDHPAVRDDPAPSEPLEAYIARVKAISARAVSRPAQGMASRAETTDPRLTAALAALEATPTAGGYIAVGMAYRRIGINDAALRYFAKATERDPAAAAAWDGLARIWRDWGLPHLGLADAYRAVHHAPDSAEARNTLGTVLQGTGRIEAARRQYEAAIALRPDAAWAWNNLCSLAAADKHREGLDACWHAVQLDPGLEIAWRNFAALQLALDGSPPPGSRQAP
jgi:tetratricopeptide (TPR) repeat protein